MTEFYWCLGFVLLLIGICVYSMCRISSIHSRAEERREANGQD